MKELSRNSFLLSCIKRSYPVHYTLLPPVSCDRLRETSQSESNQNETKILLVGEDAETSELSRSTSSLMKSWDTPNADLKKEARNDTQIVFQWSAIYSRRDPPEMDNGGSTTKHKERQRYLPRSFLLSFLDR